MESLEIFLVCLVVYFESSLGVCDDFIFCCNWVNVCERKSDWEWEKREKKVIDWCVREKKWFWKFFSKIVSWDTNQTSL